MKATEKWKPVIGYEGLYEVSSRGRVRSLTRRVHGGRVGWSDRIVAGQTMKPSRKINGYMQITFCDNGRNSTQTIHATVAAAFLGRRPNGMQVNHIDGDKLNNAASNLEYVTAKENVRHAFECGLSTCKGEMHPNSKLTTDQVREIRRRYAAGGVSHYDLADEYPVNRPTIGKILSGKMWGHVA